MTNDQDNTLTIGLVSISDRASAGVYRDEGLPALEDWCRRAITTPLRVHQRLIADERYLIENTLRDLVDNQRCHLVLTSGGTGPAARDVTPEATLAVASRELPGFAEQMRRVSLRFVPTAILSRQVAVLREIPGHAALIINLPGRPRAIAETLAGAPAAAGRAAEPGIFAAVPYCLDLIGGPRVETDPSVVVAFRPGQPAPAVPAADQEDAPEPAGEVAPPPVAPATAPVAPPPPPREASLGVPRQGVTGPRPQMSPEAIARRSVRHGVPLYNDRRAAARPADDLRVLVQDCPGGQEARCSVIWLHGLGAGPSDFADFASELLDYGAPPARFYFPEAPRLSITARDGWSTTAWYDLLSEDFTTVEDERGVKAMHLRLTRVINQIITAGERPERVFLGGFSQGAAMSLYCAPRQVRTLAGVIALSGYLPLASSLAAEITPAGRATPIFMAHGTRDEVVAPGLARRGADALERLTQTLIWRQYDMAHEVGPGELANIAQFMNTALQG